MIKTRNITEIHFTPAGSVEVEIRTTVSGPNDGVATIDRALKSHITSLRPNVIAEPVDRHVDEGSVQVYAPES